VCQYLLPSYFSTEAEVKQAIRKLNNGKAADENGIQAEHFKFANAELATEICSITNQIFSVKDFALEIAVFLIAL
jgi:hypothetical protein